MEVDSDEGSSRVDTLEKQVSDLHAQAVQLQKTVAQQAHESGSQFQELQMQLNHAHFEQAINSQAAQLQVFQDTFQEQFRQQVSHQQQMLDGMFSKQMSQFESLLAKRHKPE